MTSMTIRNIIYSVLLLFVTIFFLSCHNSGVFVFDSNRDADNIPRMEFINSVSTMYKSVGLTDHFPESWHNAALRTDNWNAYYFSPCDDSTCHCYRCISCFIDKFSDKYIDSLTRSIKYSYKTLFYDSSILRFDPVFINQNTYTIQSPYDTSYAPIYDFSDAVFNNNVIADSIFFDGRFWYGEHQVAPSDLIVYVVEAKSGNFWNNSCNAEREDRSALPQSWKNGFSRGIAVSHSCQKVCWWTMAW